MGAAIILACGNFVPWYFSANEFDRYGSINILNRLNSITKPACPNQCNVTSPDRGPARGSRSRSRNDVWNVSTRRPGNVDTSPADITAVGQDDRSGHQARRVAGEKQNDCCHFINASHPVHRRTTNPVLQLLLVLV